MFTRRRFLQSVGALAVSGCARGQGRFASYPFTLGVASGYPSPSGITLWTRLTSLLDPVSLPLKWEVASDESMRTVVSSGETTANPDWSHSVHVDVQGLEPDRWYWYRFTASDAQSPIGRTRTAPAAAADTARLRFAFASCQQYEQGYFSAYRHIVADDPDLIAFLGDYIYESTWGREHVRSHGSPEPYSLEDYRARHALYKGDPDLRAAHAACPWIFTWDDHEVSNDYANEQGQYLQADFVQRRAAAYRAYYEHMPLERAMLPQGAGLRLYERFEWGRLAAFHMLDDRQYRHIQVCPHPKRGGGSNVIDDAACPERRDPQRSLLGAAQEQWLHAGLADSVARWNVLGQQSIMAQLDRTPGPGATYWTDSWDGYPAARRRLLDFVAERKPGNVVVIGGDVHSHWVCDLKQDFDRPESPAVATEFCGTSITSQAWAQARNAALLPDNAHVKFVSSERRGYVVMAVTAKACQVQLRGIDNEKLRETGIATQASFVVEDGRPGAQPT